MLAPDFHWGVHSVLGQVDVAGDDDARQNEDQGVCYELQLLPVLQNNFSQCCSETDSKNESAVDFVSK